MSHYFNDYLPYIINRRKAGITRTGITRIKSEQLEVFPYQTEIIAENLPIPWAIAISEDGKILFTERTGRIRIIENGILRPQPLFTFGPPFISEEEGGLLGIVLDPEYLENQTFYVMQTYREGGQVYNRILRMVEVDDEATTSRVIFDKIPGSRIHNGGRIKIGPDRKLYIATGDAGNPFLAQDLNSTAGKILRLNLDGSIPEDNPFPGSPVYSLGHRNPQGLAWNEQNILYASEHGQTAQDEINIIQPGANYGWPLVQGDQTREDIEFQKPLIHSGIETWAPSGITFVTQGPWKGKLLVASLRGEQLLVITLNDDGTEVLEVESHLKHTYGRIREVVEGNDGSLYLATSNMDGRGNVQENDDKIIRLIPQTRIGGESMSQSQGTFERYEKKYLMNEKKYKMIRQEFQDKLQIDQYGKTTICNVYFDTPNYQLIRNSLEKPIYKEKLRLRSYGIPEDGDTVFIELKKKYKGIVYKRREEMELSVAEQYLYEKKPIEKPTQIAKEIDWTISFYKEVIPTMYISYSRIAMFGLEDPELRVTFDSNLLWRTEELKLEKGSWGKPLLEEGWRLMEIKIPGAMPVWLSNILDEMELYPITFSKYGGGYQSLVQQNNIQGKGEIKYA